MYCIIGPAENIIQVTFAPEKHAKVQQLLKDFNSNVRLRKVRQKEFRFDAMFGQYFTGRLKRFTIPADSPLIEAGTDFQKRVWQHIAAISYGSSITYRELAALASSPKGSRAVGLACGANPLAVIIPCHRVVSVNGLGGFAGGVAVKKALLALEQGASQAVK